MKLNIDLHSQPKVPESSLANNCFLTYSLKFICLALLAIKSELLE